MCAVACVCVVYYQRDPEFGCGGSNRSTGLEDEIHHASVPRGWLLELDHLWLAV